MSNNDIFVWFSGVAFGCILGGVVTLYLSGPGIGPDEDLPW